MLRQTDKRTVKTNSPQLRLSTNRGLIPDRVTRLYYRSVEPLVAFLIARDVNPNWLSAAGFVAIAIAGGFLVQGRFYAALVCVILGGLFDSIDGRVANGANRVTRFGAICDSVLDRYSDSVVLITLAVYFHRQQHFLTALIAIIALAGGFMTSYIRAVGRSHGVDSPAGLLRRQERMAVVTVALALSSLDPYVRNWLNGHWQAMGTWPNLPVAGGVWFLAIFSNVTAIQRLLKLRKLSQNA